MAYHSTKNTISRAKFCNKCNRSTQHRVTDGRVQHCLECADRVEQEHQNRKPHSEIQQTGFNFTGESK